MFLPTLGKVLVETHIDLVPVENKIRSHSVLMILLKWFYTILTISMQKKKKSQQNHRTVMFSPRDWSWNQGSNSNQKRTAVVKLTAYSCIKGIKHTNPSSPLDFILWPPTINKDYLSMFYKTILYYQSISKCHA